MARKSRQSVQRQRQPVQRAETGTESPATATPEPPRETRKVLDALVANIRKQFGKDAIRLTAEPEIESVEEVLPTGLPSLDRAIGVGGFPLGKLTQLVGGESA